jgi:hypothetical protein
MLNSVLNVHVPPVSFVRPESSGAAPRFASEALEEVAVSASSGAVEEPVIVYSGGFARAKEAAAPTAVGTGVYAPEIDFLPSEAMLNPDQRDHSREIETVLTEQPVMVASGFQPRIFPAGFAQEEQESQEEDLDVPAFLRRGGL